MNAEARMKKHFQGIIEETILYCSLYRLITHEVHLETTVLFNT